MFTKERVFMSRFLYQYKKCGERTINNLKNLELCFNSMEQLNDPFEGICLFQQNDLEGCSEKEDVKQDKIKEITNNLVYRQIDF